MKALRTCHDVYLLIHVQTKERVAYSTAGAMATRMRAEKNLTAFVAFCGEVPLKFRKDDTQRQIIKKSRTVRRLLTDRSQGLFPLCDVGPLRQTLGLWNEAKRHEDFAGRECRIIDLTGEYGALMALGERRR